MRLTQDEQQFIRSAVFTRDPEAEVWLFGSRADDSMRGGDIDLLILSRTLDTRGESDIWWELQEKLGEQKIDIIVAKDLSAPFVRMAKSAGVRL